MRIITATVLVLLLLTGYLLRDNPPHQTSTPLNTNTMATQSSFMTGVSSLRTTQQGSLQLKINAKTVRETSKGNIILKSPRIVVYNTQHNPPWHIHADWGYTDTHAETLRLKTRVELTQTTQAHGTRYQRLLKTDELLIFIKRRYATTDKPVTMIDNHSQLNAKGLRADLKHDKIELLSNVRGETQTKK